MPELPEVQTIVDGLNGAGVPGRVVVRVETDWPRMIEGCSQSDFYRRMEGARIETIGRRGKFIVCGLSCGSLLLHLRMSGRVNLVRAGTEHAKHEHLVLVLNDGRELRLHDTRKFGRVYLVDDENEILGALGMEPLSPQFRSERFARAIASRKRMIKPLLLDQGIVAGLGNIYVDEALWRAGVHPLRQACDLGSDEVRALWRAIRSVLKRGIENGGTSLGNGMGNYSSVSGARGSNQRSLDVYGRSGMPCKQCGEPIVRIVVAQRGTHLCPACQPLLQQTTA